jgi:hypothetical protein
MRSRIFLATINIFRHAHATASDHDGRDASHTIVDTTENGIVVVSTNTDRECARLFLTPPQAEQIGFALVAAAKGAKAPSVQVWD